MALLNHAKRELNAKIVYYGPGLSGKTTNLEWVHRKWEPDKRGKLISLETKTDRTLFFDFLPVQIGEIGGYRTRFNVYTVPGQIFYNETRKMVLKGVDGVVFVADSQQEMASENVENLRNLAENLKFIGKDIKKIPVVLQYNKRDLPNTLAVQELNRLLNPDGIPYFEAIAVQGEGVLTTLARITRMVADHLRASLFAADQEGTTAPPPQVPPPEPKHRTPTRGAAPDSMFASPTEDGPAFLGETEQTGSPSAVTTGDPEAARFQPLVPGTASLLAASEPVQEAAPAEPLPTAPIELPDILGEEALATRPAAADKDTTPQPNGSPEVLPASPEEVGPSPGATNWVDPSVVSFAPDSRAADSLPVEISVLLGNPEREAANEIQIPLSIRRNGTGERLTFRLVIRLDSNDQAA